MWRCVCTRRDATSTAAPCFAELHAGRKGSGSHEQLAEINAAFERELRRRADGPHASISRAECSGLWS